MKNVQCAIRINSLVTCGGDKVVLHAHQLSQIFAILPIRLPNPVSARSMLPACCQEDNGIIRFNSVNTILDLQ